MRGDRAKGDGSSGPPPGASSGAGERRSGWKSQRNRQGRFRPSLTRILLATVLATAVVVVETTRAVARGKEVRARAAKVLLEEARGRARELGHLLSLTPLPPEEAARWVEEGGATGTSPFRSLSGVRPSVLLLDTTGVLLVYPEKSWIGRPVLSGKDSLYDPALWKILPEALSESSNAWCLVSDVLSQGSWVRARSSLLASVPVPLPDGGRWQLWLYATPPEGAIPGVPSPYRTAVLAFVSVAVVLGLVHLLPEYRKARIRADEAETEAARWQVLFRESPEALVLVDGQDRIVEANRAFLDLVGRSWSEVAGVRLGEFFAEGKGLRRDREGEGATTSPIEGRLLARHGPLVEVEMHCRPVSQGVPPHRLCSLRDMTWRRQEERRMLKMGEKERMVLGKALHDGLGQQLAGLAILARTFAQELTAKGTAEASEAHRIADLLREAVGEVRLLSRGLELAEYEPGELPQALEELGQVMGQLLGAQVSIRVDLPSGSPGPSLDRFQTTQVYRLCHDLLSDAVRNRLAGRIELSLEAPGEEARIHLVHDGSRPLPERARVSSLVMQRVAYRVRVLEGRLEESSGERGRSEIAVCFPLRSLEP